MRIARRGLFAAAFVLASSRAAAQEEDGALIGPPPPPIAEGPPRPAEGETPSPMLASPRAEPPPSTPFGAPGVFLLTNSTSLRLAATRYDTGDASSTSVSFSPGFDYFVTRHLSLGLDVFVSYGEQRRYRGDASLVESKTTALGVGPRLGLDLPISDLLSFYPRITVGFESRHDEERLVYGSPKNAPDALATSRGGLFVHLFAPLLLHPAPHVFIGAGPSASRVFAQKDGGPDLGGDRTTLAAGFEFGAWWGGTPEKAAPPAATPASPATTRVARFGDAEQVVISGELDASASHTSYGGSSTRATTLGVGAGFDCFVVDQLSLGLGASASYAKVTDPLASGVDDTGEITGYSASPRVGLNFPLASWLSFYPRASFTAGVTTLDGKSGTKEITYKETTLSLGLFAPFLFHVAPHAFVGFGPYVSHEIMDKVSGQSEEVLATHSGASLLVGGWL